MAIVSLTTIKNWFKTGLKPTQSQFWDVWDSFRHKSEAIPYVEIEGLDAVLLAQDVKINAIALPDDIIKEGSLIVTSTTVDIIAEDFIWRLLQVQYTNLAAFHSVLPLTTSGYNRTDIFVGTNLGTIYRVQGEQVVGVSFKPDLPDGTIELAYIDVESTAVGVPVIPKPRYPVSQSLRDGITDYAPSENVVFDALALKLNASAYNEYFKGKYTSSAALIAAHPTSIYGAYAVVDAGVGSDAKEWIWDAESGWIVGGSTGASTTDGLTEGSTNLYFTVARFLSNLTYDRVISALGFTPSTAPNNAQKNSDITKAEIEAVLTGELISHTHPSVDGGGSIDYTELNRIDSANINFVALGDSITQGFGGTNNLLGYADHINSKVGFKSYTKLGVSATNTMPSGTYPELYTQVSSIPVDANLITVMIGVNDYLRPNILGNLDVVLAKPFALLDRTLSFAEAFRFNLETIKRNFPFAKILIITPIQTNWGGNPLGLKAYVDFEIAIANYLSIPVYDAFDYGLWVGNTDVMPDGLHPNNTGHILLADYVLSEIITPKSVRAKESVYNQTKTLIEISTATTLSDIHNGRDILITANCTINIPNGIPFPFECTFDAITGVTLTFTFGTSVVVSGNISYTMTDGMCVLKSRATANNYRLRGAI